MASEDYKKLSVDNCLFLPNQYRSPEGNFPHGTIEMDVKFFKESSVDNNFFSQVKKLIIKAVDR